MKLTNITSGTASFPAHFQKCFDHCTVTSLPKMHKDAFFIHGIEDLDNKIMRVTIYSNIKEGSDEKLYVSGLIASEDYWKHGGCQHPSVPRDIKGFTQELVDELIKAFKARS